MSANATSEIPIRAEDLAHFTKRAGEWLRSVEWNPRRDVRTLAKDVAPQATPIAAFRARPALSNPSQTISLIEVAKAVGNGGELMDEHVNRTLNLIRQGLRIALHIASLYAKSSGLETLRERNERRQLGSDTEKAEFRDKNETQAAITIFVLAYYVTWSLQQRTEDMPSAESLAWNGLPESIPLRGTASALQCTLFHFGSYLKAGEALTGLDCLKLAQLYFGAVLEEMKGRAQGLKHAEAFTERNYRLERSNFSLSGFHGDAFGARAAVEFKPVDINKIVGNRDAKRHAYRMAQALLAYCFATKKNPLVELGGFPWIYLMKGIPGTGKTLLIGAILTLVAEYCKALGIPFRPHPFPNAIVSTFQGGSAENMENWMRPLMNPNELIIAPIDDAENSFQERTMQQVSSGVREVIGVFLRQTEGATAINRGNALMMFATNIPEQVDRAVLSRVLARMDVDGARTREDFLDQFRMWSDGFAKYKDGFVDLSWPADYEFLSAQTFRTAAERIAEGVREVKDKKLAQILEEVQKTHRPDQHDFYAALCVRLQKEYPFFSSRDVRNIQVAVGTRLLDFDFPEAWLTERDIFVGQTYDVKKNMIVELMRANMGTLRFSDVLYHETVTYLDTMISILDAAHRRSVADMVGQLTVQEEARAEFLARTGSQS